MVVRWLLTRGHLLRGLNALSRAHEADYFADGHRGAALIAAYYLCRREDIEPDAARTIGQMAESEWGGSALFAPLPEESPDPRLIADLTSALMASTDCLRQAGHNVILPSLALKALAEVPEAVTPTRIAGMCRLVRAFTPHPGDLEGEDVVLPGLGDPTGLAQLALSEALAAMHRFDGRGQGWTGHLLTHARAVIDLLQTGHLAAARSALAGLGHYVKRTRMGPGAGDTVWPEHPAARQDAMGGEYWHRRRSDAVGLGHCFKYPYALYALLDLAEDAGLRRACLAEAYRVL